MALNNRNRGEPSTPLPPVTRQATDFPETNFYAMVLAKEKTETLPPTSFTIDCRDLAEQTQQFTVQFSVPEKAWFR